MWTRYLMRVNTHTLRVLLLALTLMVLEAACAKKPVQFPKTAVHLFQPAGWGAILSRVPAGLCVLLSRLCKCRADPQLVLEAMELPCFLGNTDRQRSLSIQSKERKQAFNGVQENNKKACEDGEG